MCVCVCVCLLIHLIIVLLLPFWLFLSVCVCVLVSFLLLSPSYVLQLCELLCLSINMLMDMTGKESSHLQQLSESSREKVLLHLAEPLQFLHNLDIASIFEHFYK